jgi:hypothetical protein
MSRPVKIVGIGIPLGAAVNIKFNPWELFFENKRVINKIATYKNLRAKLKVKAIINGTSFHFGRLIMSYVPLNVNDSVTKTDDVPVDIIAASQRPHITLDPTYSSGGTIELPFIWPNDYLSIPDGQWRNMGELWLQTIIPLKHAIGSDSNCTVSIFAWAEDVVLAGPTAINPAYMVSQSDEYGVGPISRMATSVMKISSYLTNLPFIGNYALATQMISKTTADIASIFGFCRPAEIAPANPMKPTVFGNMANVNTPDTCTKLAIDCKQEITVDPTAAFGAPNDDMVIASIANRESYVTSFEWNHLQPAETTLFSMKVTPMISVARNDGSFQMTPSGFAAAPFTYWRGSMRYRFIVVASTFVKGRLRITYDPQYNTVGSLEYNTNFTHIVDISQGRDFTLDVGWHQSAPYKQVPLPWEGACYNSTEHAFDSRANGAFKISIVTELSTPSEDLTNALAYVVVHAQALPDMEFRAPTSQVLTNCAFKSATSPSAAPAPNPLLLDHQPMDYNEDDSAVKVLENQMDEHPDASAQDTSNEPVASPNPNSSTVMGTQLPPNDPHTSVYFGEKIVSFRALLKRYSYIESILMLRRSDSFTYFCKVVKPDFPYYRGYNFSGPYRTTDNPPQNYYYGETTLLNYLTPAFLTRRGSIRYKYAQTGAGPSTRPTTLMVSRAAGEPAGTEASGSYPVRSPQGVSDSASALFSRFMKREHPTTFGGAHATSTGVNPVVEVELPYYRPYRFSFARSLDYTNSSYVDTISNHRVSLFHCSADSTSYAIDSYVAAGDDFSLDTFISVPPIYQNLRLDDPL